MIREKIIDEVINLLKEALARLETPQPNFSGGTWQAGGFYWRICRALEFADQELDEVQGQLEADRLRQIHGILVKENKEYENQTKFRRLKKLLSKRAQNCLTVEGFKNINELLQFQSQSRGLKNINGMGDVTIREVVTWIEHNFQEESNSFIKPSQFS